MKHNYSFAGERLSPKKSTVQSILNFSKTLSVIRSGVLNETIILFQEVNGKGEKLRNPLPWFLLYVL